MNLGNLKGACFFWFAVAMSFSVSTGAAQSSAEADQQQLVFGNSGFGFRLLKELAREKPRANIFISPYSISSVLQMVSNGARGRTLDELRKVLGTTGLAAPRLNAACEELNQSISSTQTNVILKIANALWYRTGAQLNPEFAAVNEKFYRATLSALDFSQAGSAQIMNEWAAHNTAGRIKTIVQPPIPADTAIVLANAIYFKGTWLDQFDQKQTRPRAFHLPSGQEPLPMMQQTRTFLYQQGAGFQAVQLLYADQRLQMGVFLPEPHSGPESLLEKMDGRNWQDKISTGFHEAKGTLVLPRFKLRFGAELNGPLGALGLGSAFTQNADFSAMSPSHLFLSEVKHQSFVEVNEEGTEAAAATTGTMALTSFRQEPPPFQMVVDRPFLFLISDRVTKSILFIGLVFDPSHSES
jgi:serpin B